ncbi:hypothetical protein GBAR_LOCUS12069 [Geodia barretti]|uniref:Uncharacterized protein n=1 Tax=Geodia barretti TaxID=519541 RepID=A0AA35RYL6_GEOBA|nr:hypothetical protein GBAR_LOCUS12069 [Geodia barretti]
MCQPACLHWRLFYCGSPRVTESSVEAEFVTTRPVTGVRCFLRYENKNDYKDCSSECVLHRTEAWTLCPKDLCLQQLTDVAANQESGYCVSFNEWILLFFLMLQYCVYR